MPRRFTGFTDNTSCDNCGKGGIGDHLTTIEKDPTNKEAPAYSAFWIFCDTECKDEWRDEMEKKRNKTQ